MTFTNTDGQANGTTVNSIVDASISLTSLTYSNSGASLWQNTQINSGQTLTLSSTGGTVLSVGAPTANALTQAVLTGDGALTINNSTGLIQIGSLNGTSPSSGYLNMSGLANFSSNTATFNIGSLATAAGVSPGSTVILAKTSTITATTLSLGGASGHALTQALRLGSVANTLNVTTLNVGSFSSGSRASGSIVFNDTTGTVKIRAANGTGAATLNLTNSSSSATGNMVANVDFSGHQADVLLSTLTMASRAAGNGTTTATFSFDTGTLGITSVVMAVGKEATATLNLGSTGSTGASTIGSISMANTTVNSSTTSATLNVAGGTHEVTGSGNITMSSGTAGTSRVATSLINITGGTLKVGGNILEGADAGGLTKNTTLTLNGGTLDMTNGTIGNGTNAINILNFQSGTLQNVASINGTAGLTKTTAGTLTVAGTNTWTGATLVSEGTLLVSGTMTTSSGTTVSGGAALRGSGSVGNVMVDATGTISGTLTAGVLSGAGLVSPGNSPGILTATQVDGTGGLDFTFEMTQLNSPTYSNTLASGNDVLHLTSGTPFTASLTSANLITVDFSGLSLAVGQIYRGGFYASGDFFSSIQNATFQYVGALGTTFAVSTFQETANFASGTVTGGWVTQFEVLAIPEPATALLLGGGLLVLLLRRRRR